MPYSVRCKACSAVFAIPDEIWDRRIRGRTATLKCRSCKGDIEVDGRKENAGRPAGTRAAASLPNATAASTDSSLSALNHAKLNRKPESKSPTDIASADKGWSILPAANGAETPPKAQPEQPIAKVHEARSEGATDSPTEETPSDLWVVGYGDDDDRELSSEQVVSELRKGVLTGTTIVWREGLEEWLPISGIPDFAKHLPSAKAITTAKAPPPVSRPQSKTSDYTSNTAATPRASERQSPAALAVPWQDSQEPIEEEVLTSAPELPIATREEEDLTTVFAPNTPPPTEPTPPLPSSASRSTPKAAPLVVSASAASKPTAPQAAARGTPTAPSAAVNVAPTATAPAAPVAKAPPQAPASIAKAPPQAPTAQTPSAASTPALNLNAVAMAPAPGPAGLAVAQAIPASQELSSPSVTRNFRPPKPAETSTSLVRHTQHVMGADVLSLTDDDFLAMQRRLPRWAMPAGVVGGALLLGVLVYTIASKEDEPPLPTAPIVTPTAGVSDALGNDQPNLGVAPARAAGNSGEGDFAKAFAQVAGKKAGAFDPKAAERSAGAAMERASKCHYGRDPAGNVRATITISPAGRVTDVQVAAPHATTTTGKCVANALAAATTSPFKGEDAKLTLTVTLR